MWIQGLIHPRIPQIQESRDVVDEVSLVFMVFELMAIGSEGRNACKNIFMNKNGRSPVNTPAREVAGTGRTRWCWPSIWSPCPPSWYWRTTVLLSTMMVFFAMMVLVFKIEIERWGFLCGPKIWTGIISTLFSLRVSVEAEIFK